MACSIPNFFKGDCMFFRNGKEVFALLILIKFCLYVLKSTAILGLSDFIITNSLQNRGLAGNKNGMRWGHSGWIIAIV